MFYCNFWWFNCIAFIFGSIGDYRYAKSLTKNLNRYISINELLSITMGLNLFKSYDLNNYKKYFKFLDPLSKQLLIQLQIDLDNPKEINNELNKNLSSKFNLDNIDIEVDGNFIGWHSSDVIAKYMGLNYYSLDHPPSENDLIKINNSINESNVQKYFLSVD